MPAKGEEMRRYAVILSVAVPGAALGQALAAGDDVAPVFRILPKECTDPDGEEIVVCGSRDGNARFRLPKISDRFDPRGPVDSVGRERVRLMEGGESGVGSCSNRGPGGLSGCWLQSVKDKRLQEGR